MINVMLWGTGKRAKEVLTNCRTLSEYRIIGVIDSDKIKRGKWFMGYQVFEPEYILECDVDKIVVLADCYYEIKSQILSIMPEVESKVENKYYFYKESLLKRYRTTEDMEIVKITNYIRKHGLDYFNYDFKKNYELTEIEVLLDRGNSLFYVIHNGKKMYFPRNYTDPHLVKEYYRSLLIEQDIKSPHHYIDDQFQVDEGDIVIDAGAAEGMFALNIIDKASRVYLVEADEYWIEALKITFEPYRKKVKIIDKYISSYDEGVIKQLDTIIEDEPNFIKMDIEGNEWDALRGAKEIIAKSHKLKMAICCYHSDFDQVLIENYMDKMGIRHITTEGYMWFPELVRQNYVSCSLHKAIVRGIKNNDR